MDFPERPPLSKILLEMPFVFILLVILIFVYVLGITIGWRIAKRTANKIVSPAGQIV